MRTQLEEALADELHRVANLKVCGYQPELDAVLFNDERLGSFFVKKGETVDQGWQRLKARYRKEGQQ